MIARPKEGGGPTLANSPQYHRYDCRSGATYCEAQVIRLTSTSKHHHARI
jgi:hypothetical protein